MRNKPIGFRPTDTALAILKRDKAEHPKKSWGDLVNDRIELSDRPSLDADITGKLIRCFHRPYVIELFMSHVTILCPVDSSVCKSCPDYPCDEWQGIFAEQRANLKHRKG